MPLKKRLFDLVVCLLAAAVWIPVLVACSLANWLGAGRPVFYVSERRVFRSRSIPVLKFRTMVRNADRIANRHTVPIAGTRFLNIPPDSPLYTGVGRGLERYHLTELPQLVHVLKGQMTLVGNRPLPENVIGALREQFPWAEDRFLIEAGMTGPVQLVGRDNISDEARLTLEVDYCRACNGSYSPVLDLTIIFYTVLMALRLRDCFTVEEVRRLMRRFGGYPVARVRDLPGPVVPGDSLRD